jgi:hypothetical protein
VSHEHTRTSPWSRSKRQRPLGGADGDRAEVAAGNCDAAGRRRAGGECYGVRGGVAGICGLLQQKYDRAIYDADSRLESDHRTGSTPGAGRSALLQRATRETDRGEAHVSRGPTERVSPFVGGGPGHQVTHNIASFLAGVGPPALVFGQRGRYTAPPIRQSIHKFWL